MDPEPVPEHRVLRDQRRPHRGRRQGGGRGLLQQGRLRPRPEGIGAARRAPAGAVRVQPVPEPPSGEAAAQRGARPDGGPGLRRPGQGSARRGGRARSRRRQQVRDDPPAVFLRLRRPGADRSLRGSAGTRGRAEGLHDDQPAAPGLRRAGGRRLRGVRIRALDGAGLHRRDQRAHPRDGVVGQLRAVAEQPRGERPPATRLVVQAVRAHHGAQAGDRPEHHLLQRDQRRDPLSRWPVRHAVDGEQRGAGGRSHEPGHRDDRVGQRRLRTA